MMSLATSTLALLAVLLLAYLIIKGGARLHHLQNRKGSIAIKESASLGNRERIVLIDYKDKSYLLAVTAQNVSVIDSHDKLLPSNRP